MGKKIAAVVLLGIVVAAAAIAWIFILAPAPTYAPWNDDGDAQYAALPDGGRLAYFYHPAPALADWPPVVLLHGGPGAPAVWPAALIDAITGGGRDVYDYHQIGAGLSTRLADVEGYTLAQQVSDLEAMRALTGHDTVVLLGTSSGAQLLAHYLAAHPQRVERAIIVSPAPIWPAAFTDETRLTEGGRLDQQRAVSQHPRMIATVILTGVLGAASAHALLPDERMDGVYQAMVESLDMNAGCEGLAADPRSKPLPGYGYWVNVMTTRDAARNAADPRATLAAVEVPALVVRGSCDYIAPAVAAEYADLMRNAEVASLEGAGHALVLERPEEFAALVGAFLAQ